MRTALIMRMSRVLDSVFVTHFEEFHVVIPGDLLADGVALLLVIVGSVGCSGVVEFSPQKLSQKRHWRFRMLLPLFVHLQENK
jgi:hypothetical protein